MLKRLVKKIFKPKSFIALVLVLLLISVMPTKTAHAFSVIETVLDVFGTIMVALVWVIGQLLLVVISVLVEVAQYNGFITAPAVVQGWAIVRDLCNMFFVLILLVIAFATILHIPNYSIKQLLKRVIIFAVLINFSKMICGLLIDAAQVVMLTFVNGFKDIGGGNFTFLLGMDKLLAMDKKDWDATGSTVDIWSIIASYLLAFLYAVVMLVVMIALLGTLVFRIVMLWIYIILSPMAYLAAVAPLSKGMNSTWWRDFSKNLIAGPVLAFFIWLSLATLGQFNDTSAFLKDNGFNTPDAANMPKVGVTEVGTTAHMMRFVVSLGLLIGGLIVAKSFGGAAGAMAGAGMSRLQSGAGWMKKQTVDRAQRAAVAGGKAAGQAAWGGVKATGQAAGRAGLNLAKSVDYQVSREVASTLGRDYQSGQGVFTRVAGFTYNNVMTKEGLKNNFNKITGHKFDNVRSQQKMAAKASGHHIDENGVEYIVQADRSLMSASGHKLGWKVDSEFGNKYKQFAHASKYGVAKDNAQSEKAKKEYDDLMSPYKNKSKEELHALIEGTNNHSQLKGIFAALGEKGQFKDQQTFDRAKQLFSTNPAQMKSLLEKTREKQAELVFDLSNSDQKEALEKLIKKNKIKLEEQSLATLDTKTDAGKENLAALAEVFKESLHKERWANTVNKIDKEGDPKVAEKLAEAFAHNARKEEEKRSAAEAQIFANENRDRDVGNKLNINQNELAVAEADYQADPNNITKAVRVRDLKQEKQNLEDEKITLAEEKAEAIKASEQHSNKIASWRADKLTLDLKGDAVEAFTDQHGQFNSGDFEKYLSKASAKQLGGINSDSVAENSGARSAMANNITYERLKALERSGNNPDLAKMIAQEKVKNYDPESSKIINIYNDINADLPKAQINDLIKSVLRQAGSSESGNLAFLNKMRASIENHQINTADKDAIEKYLKNNSVI